jgi:hypothetical protein
LRFLLSPLFAKLKLKMLVLSRLLTRTSGSQRVTVWPAVYRQSVRLGAKPLEVTTGVFFFWQLNQTHAVIVISDERIGLSLTIMLGLCEVYVSHIQHDIKICSLCNICTSSVSTGFAQQIMSVLLILWYNGSFITWTVVILAAAELNPLYICVWLRLVLCCEHVRSHDFMWLLVVACTVFLYNRMHKEGWKPFASLPYCSWPDDIFPCARLVTKWRYSTRLLIVIGFGGVLFYNFSCRPPLWSSGQSSWL